jgi:hypothetical protein
MRKKSDKFIVQEVKRLSGSWDTIIQEAEQRFGQRGKALALLFRPVAVHGSTRACERSLKDAGLEATVILQKTEQQRSIKGFQRAISIVREWIAEGVCVHFINKGSCGERDCSLKHEIPTKGERV